MAPAWETFSTLSSLHDWPLTIASAASTAPVCTAWIIWLISMIDANRQHVNLCSALRLFVLASYRSGALPTADVVAVR